ncbi:MAG: amino acid ABC transporter ATP-binding protein [Alphaproteobacteria bacterium 16-39-46]|nr:MAG: amino acid ABC transporter ATP-binding protein [Alphaproteobacteria bacterium 16-39-46]OZA43320.1 MAG: amino acid ABC transporter ATP-binding protein [Alphaproteobacteria bacterium 17-39-52]HQS83924.1 ATP-binding cassette domain-containing protein [Alphaproteobacteria bacterium]HQS93790.1 ATP-binding cassette domain-containing protein [Alphaproteobacteria bacterium]
MLKIQNVFKKFGEIEVLKNITLEFSSNKIIGLAGPSGSGKSTLLRCLQKLEPIDSGVIECTEKTGFMFQDFQLFPHMTVLQNLTYAPTLQRKTKDTVPEALALLKTLGLKHKETVYPNKLSGGQKQRVALARSLMMHPQILLCDEPTSGLDVATVMDIVSLLKSVKDLGVTMIIASHDLDFLTKIADQIILLKNGEIVLNTDLQTLKEDPIQCLKKYY